MNIIVKVLGSCGKAARFGWLLGLVSMALVLGGPEARAANLLERVKDQEIKQTLRLRVGHSKVLRTPYAITRISVANPEVADILLLGEREIYITGLHPGTTNLSLWGKARFSTAAVHVEPDVSLLKEKLAQILPKEKIGVEAAGESIVLSGEISGPIAQESALSLALPYVGGKKERLVNLLHVGGVQQVLVEVRLAEIDRTVGRRMGINFSGISHSGNFGVSQIGGLGSISALVRSFTGTAWAQSIATGIPAVGGWKAAGVLWTAFFDILKQENLGRILAEPNLVTTSGQEASFLAGGEFPYPEPQPGAAGATITIKFKKFGVGLVFTPTVLDEGKIAMKVTPEVSELDFTTTVTYVGLTVPSLRVRSTSTHVEVRDGQTFAIAGLIGDQHRSVMNKFPVLGDIPVLGALFRSSQYQRQETELVVLVTPHLVKPLTTTAARLPTERFVEPSDYEFYLLGAAQGVERRKPPPPKEAFPPGFGYQPVE